DLDGRALAGLAPDDDPPADGKPSLLEIAQPEASLWGRWVEALPIIVDLEHGVVAISVKTDPTGRGLRMLADIGKSFPCQLNQVGRPRCELGGECAINVGHGRDSAFVLELSGQVLERLLELAIGQDSRAKAKNVVAQVTNRSVDLCYRRLDPRFDFRIAA